MKCILVICDGMGDRPCKDHPKTPLETAYTPSLDQLAEKGICGIMDPIRPGIRPGSDTAHLALFGYDPFVYYKGRGAFEALGAGIDIQPGEIALRANFATINSENVIIDRRAGRTIPEGDQFAALLHDLSLPSAPDVKVTFIHTVEHRGVLKLHGSNLSYKVSDMDPDLVNVKVQTCRPLDESPQAQKTAKILNEFFQLATKILSASPLNDVRRQKKLPPVNSILLRGAGIIPDLQSLSQKYSLRTCCICGAPLYRGVAKVLGMTIIDVPGATGTVNTNTIAKGQAALQNLESFNFIFLHIKGTDSASHDGNYLQKVMVIEKIDAMVKLLLNNVELDDTLIVLTADHADPICVQDHTADPVPVVITGGGVLSDDIKIFSERTCANGGLGRIRGLDLIPIIMDLMNKIKKFGA
ncbi:MAG TPA: 2,3-bisphosphoglycerate-independent phosphoglycerate mutase [Candidatus Deferrimicrobium sp.]|nr:2,3-bisphosphoglycerate-independent phosphoglycerate mutase [Candidatus Deferrimicrobium sp.]